MRVQRTVKWTGKTATKVLILSGYNMNTEIIRTGALALARISVMTREQSYCGKS